MKSHMTGTNILTARSIDLVPDQTITAFMIQTMTT